MKVTLIHTNRNDWFLMIERTVRGNYAGEAIAIEFSRAMETLATFRYKAGIHQGANVLSSYIIKTKPMNTTELNSKLADLELNSEFKEFFQTLRQQADSKVDIVTMYSQMQYEKSKLSVLDSENVVMWWNDYTPTEMCHAHLAEELGIPIAYYKRLMEDYPSLLESNINMWLLKNPNNKILLRTFYSGESNGNNIARAILSDRFQIIDNWQLFFTVAEAINEMGVEFEIKSAVITEKKMYIHIHCPSVFVYADSFLNGYLPAKDSIGNKVYGGLVITNSEVGQGTFQIQPRATIEKSGAGFISSDEAYKRVHLGVTLPLGVLHPDEHAKKKNYELIMNNTKLAVHKFLSHDYLRKTVNVAEHAHKIMLLHPIDTMQNICKELPVDDADKSAILQSFLQDGDSHASGIFHAIIKQAAEMEADQRYLMESAALGMMSRIKKYDKVYTK